ncbi:MAG: endonuclease/exonuclease/phosphatase family protein [Bacteroidales bacterium]|jgi:endonuclease/exonuclease/phosphatase family metal-dependent hydrolase|nr:endonuclease/exonuclease/phosphatase family protein [Bacteroidales bacterium]
MKRIIRVIFLTINIVAAGCLLLAYLCCWVNPEKVWWLGLLGLGYLYLLIINLFFTGFWLFTAKKKYAVLSLLIVVLGWGITSRNVRFFGKNMSPALTEKSITLLSFNVHMFHQANGTGENGEKLNIHNFFRESQADILCLQEFANVDKMPEHISSGTKMPHCHVEMSVGQLGIATFSRYPIVGRKLLYSDNSVNACMYTDLLVAGDTIRVFNVHLKSIGFGYKQRDLLENAIRKEYKESDVKTVKSIIKEIVAASIRRSKQVKIVEGHIAESPYPIIICGDFNDPPVSYSYQKIRAHRKDAFMEAGHGFSFTYNLGRIFHQRIDFILHSPEFEAYDYKSPRVILSDHFPITCKLVKK